MHLALAGNRTPIPHSACSLVQGCTNSGRLNLVRLRQTFVGRQYGTCYMSPFWRLDIWKIFAPAYRVPILTELLRLLFSHSNCTNYPRKGKFCLLRSQRSLLLLRSAALHSECCILTLRATRQRHNNYKNTKSFFRPRKLSFLVTQCK